MAKDTIRKGNMFNKFDVHEFLKEKRFALVSIDEKYRYDASKKKMTDDYIGLSATVEIAVDRYDYSYDSDGSEIGINKGVRIEVVIKGANKSDYEFLIPDDPFGRPSEVEIKVDDFKYFSGKSGNNLTIEGDVILVNESQSDNG
ncbi:hypothetical protein [Staphylococcus haemolyticus]|uniref:hypothetical protein n=1 Tax=Staphylococcus haemolyticus TaxID=1283 RepID=UPI0034D4B062